MIVLVVGVTIAIAFDAMLGYIRSFLLLLLHQQDRHLRLTSHDLPKLLSLPMEFFERNTAGVLSKHMQQDQRIREFLTGRLLLTLLDATALLVFLPVLLFYSVATDDRGVCSAPRDPAVHHRRRWRDRSAGG